MKNKLLFGVVVLFLLISVQQTKAAEINTLNDGSTAKNLTFDTPGSEIVYIEISRYANVSKAEWNLTGYPVSEDDTEDSWIKTGNDCSYPTDCSDATDENWDTDANHESSGRNSYIYENTTLFNDQINWTSKFWDGPGNNFHISYWNYTLSNWQVLYSDGNTDLTTQSFPIPDDGTTNDLLQIRTYFAWNTGSEIATYYEGQVIYINGVYPSNITIDTGTDGINDYANTTEFNTSERIDLNATAIMNDLRCCSSNLCNVSFNTSSDSNGILRVSDIEIIYEEYDAITDCSGDNDSPSLIFEHFHEGSLDEINASLDITFEATVYGNQTDNYSFTFPENHSHTICISPVWASYTSDAFGVYYSTTHSQRSFYLAGGTLTNSTQTINLYSLNTTESDAVVIYVKDVTGLFVEDVYIKIQRYYPGTGTYNTVAYMRTDEDGKDMTYLYLNDVYYKFILELNGVIEREISPRTITDSVDDPEVIIFSLYGSGIEYFQIEDINYGCTYNNATFLLRCTVSDSTNLMTESCLRTERLEILSSTLINESCETDSAVTYIHNITNTTGDYIYTLTISTNSNDYNVITGSINVPGTASAFGDWGIFIVFLIVMVAGGLGMVYPPAGGVFAVLGLIVGIYAGFVDIAISSVVGLLLVAGIYLIKGKS